MKVALPCRDNQVDGHFGHCEYFTVFSIGETGEILEEHKLIPPPSCGCKSDIVSQLAALGVETMLAGNIGAGAVNVLGMHGIKVARGFSGDPRHALSAWLAGTQLDCGETCTHHGGCH
jgi:predicted Fe-Mo cluster-binding NifX family protein